MTATTDWTPPPPGDTREKLPAHLLAMIVALPYMSTACQTGRSLTSAIVRHPESAFELEEWSRLMHKRCRLNNKFTDLKCTCACGHPRDEDTGHAIEGSAAG
jgi:hypothetical protein